MLVLGQPFPWWNVFLCISRGRGVTGPSISYLLEASNHVVEEDEKFLEVLICCGSLILVGYQGLNKQATEA
jgi:hypothetical protein